MKSIDKDTKEFIIIMLIWLAIVIPLYVLWYDFKNYTNCFIQSSVILLGIEPNYTWCNIGDL